MRACNPAPPIHHLTSLFGAFSLGMTMRTGDSGHYSSAPVASVAYIRAADPHLWAIDPCCWCAARIVRRGVQEVTRMDQTPLPLMCGMRGCHSGPPERLHDPASMVNRVQEPARATRSRVLAKLRVRPFRVVQPSAAGQERQETWISEHATAAAAFAEIDRFAEEMARTGGRSDVIQLRVVDSCGQIVSRPGVH
jgi:hypothetical protein